MSLLPRALARGKVIKKQPGAFLAPFTIFVYAAKAGM